MRVKDWVNLINFKITSGEEYIDNRFGKIVRLEYWDNDFDGISSDIIYNKDTMNVYEVTIHDYSKQLSHRWYHPDHAPTDHEAYDGVMFNEMTDALDWIKKAEKILNL